MRGSAKVLVAVAIVACGGAPDGGPGNARRTAGDTAAPAAPPAPAPDSAGAPFELPEAAGEWTTGRLVGAPGAGVATLRAVRAARHEGYDRVVFEFDGGLLPGYRAEYVDSPQHQCGSGDEVRLPGDAWIQVDLEPGRAHDDEGRATVEQRTQRPGLPNLVELRLICDFEAQVGWVLGLRSPSPFRILRLADPARLVLDVRH